MKNKNINGKLILAIIILLSTGLSSACGFRILNGKESLAAAADVQYKNKKYSNISQIYLKPFKNLTYKSGEGVYFSDSISNYLNEQTYMFTSNKSNALYYLTGKITAIQNSVMSYTGVAAAVDYMITVNVTVSLYKADGKIIFRNAVFSSNADYFNYINPLVAHKQEKRAIETASKRIARKIIIYMESKKLTLH
jgi:outer membrane lipopolysaccharide assembly protein LptE/RlpB